MAIPLFSADGPFAAAENSLEMLATLMSAEGDCAMAPPAAAGWDLVLAGEDLTEPGCETMNEESALIPPLLLNAGGAEGNLGELKCLCLNGVSQMCSIRATLSFLDGKRESHWGPEKISTATLQVQAMRPWSDRPWRTLTAPAPSAPDSIRVSSARTSRYADATASLVV